MKQEIQDNRTEIEAMVTTSISIVCDGVCARRQDFQRFRGGERGGRRFYCLGVDDDHVARLLVFGLGCWALCVC